MRLTSSWQYESNIAIQIERCWWFSYLLRQTSCGGSEYWVSTSFNINCIYTLHIQTKRGFYQIRWTEYRAPQLWCSLSLGWHGNRVWYSCTHDKSYEKCNTSTCQSFEYAIKSMRKSITYPNINHYTQYLYTLHCLYIYTILIWHLCGTQISYSVSINFTLPSEIY